MKAISILFMCVFISTFLSAQKNLQIFGGKDHDVYLGCLNCNEYSTNSIWNAYSNYGNSYSSTSIWNSYGNYGSGYSNYSPFNTYANYPPVIVDDAGGFYGYFTINVYKDKRADFSLVLTIYKYYDLIRDDVGKWHDKIFE